MYPFWIFWGIRVLMLSMLTFWQIDSCLLCWLHYTSDVIYLISLWSLWCYIPSNFQLKMKMMFKFAYWGSYWRYFAYFGEWNVLNNIYFFCWTKFTNTYFNLFSESILMALLRSGCEWSRCKLYTWHFDEWKRVSL